MLYFLTFSSSFTPDIFYIIFRTIPLSAIPLSAIPLSAIPLSAIIPFCLGISCATA